MANFKIKHNNSGVKRFVTFITEHFLITQKYLLVKLDYKNWLALNFCNFMALHQHMTVHVYTSELDDQKLYPAIHSDVIKRKQDKCYYFYISWAYYRKLSLKLSPNKLQTEIITMVTKQIGF